MRPIGASCGFAPSPGPEGLVWWPDPPAAGEVTAGNSEPRGPSLNASQPRPGAEPQGNGAKTEKRKGRRWGWRKERSKVCEVRGSEEDFRGGF
jgi:hypothetical protein